MSLKIRERKQRYNDDRRRKKLVYQQFHLAIVDGWCNNWFNLSYFFSRATFDSRPTTSQSGQCQFSSDCHSLHNSVIHQTTGSLLAWRGNSSCLRTIQKVNDLSLLAVEIFLTVKEIAFSRELIFYLWWTGLLLHEAKLVCAISKNQQQQQPINGRLREQFYEWIISTSCRS